MNRGILLTLLVVIIIAGLGAGYYWLNMAKTDAENPSNIEISQYEKRVFKTLTLKNGLDVVLVSDPESDKAAAALNVFTGSWANPEDAQGMAHFLEHMLFLGTEKYPNVDDYQTFIEQNGGSDNAYTSSENTLYFFDIASNELTGALDRFSQFFIAPLFDPEFSDRERNAVHSEYSASLQNDARRIEDVIRELAEKTHPSSKLAIGNLETLNVPDMSSRLQDFFREHYVAGNMALAVYGPQSIDELETLVEELFSGIRSTGDVTPTVYSQDFIASAKLPMLVEIKPRKELRQLEFRFPIPATAENLTIKPYQYIGHLLGHESSGSLLSALKNKGWAENLSAGSGGLTLSNTSFNVRIQLTPEGLENWQSVAQLLFSNIELIRSEGIHPWIFDEQKNINEINFQFAEKVSASNTAVSLAERLRYYEASQILSGPYKLGEFDPTPIQQALTKLIPDNALIILAHPDATTEQESQYYQTPYRAQTLTGNTVANWRSAKPTAELAIPERNPFVPSQLVVTPLEREESILYKYTPQVIAQDENRVVWFEQDDEFKTPKTDIHLLLEGNFFEAAPENVIAMSLYIDLINDALNEVRYQASLAGSGYGISVVEDGIQLRLYGYQDKLPLLFDTLALELAEHTISADRFAIKRQEYLRNLRNLDEDPVINQVVRRLNLWMLSNSIAVSDQIKAAEAITAEKVLAARQAFFESATMSLLIHGNLTEAQAIALADRIDAVIPQQGEETAARKVAKLSNRPFLTQMSIDHSDSAFMQIHQGENSSLRERALYALLAEAMSAPYFADLRTKQQLGYIVLARPYPIDGLPGLILYIQSPHTDPALLHLYSDRFLNRYSNEIASMTDKTFAAYKQGLITSLTEPDKNLFELSGRYWREIQNGNEHFNTMVRIANEVEKISLDGFRRFYQNRILGDENRSLTIHQVGAQMSEDYQEHIENVVGFYPISEPKNWPDDVEWITPTFNNL